MDGFERSDACASRHSQASFTPMRQVRRVTEIESIVHISETFRSVRPAVGRYAKDADNDSMDDFAAKTHC